METEVFLDTSYVIALASARDAHHQKAVKLAQQIEKNETLLVTTRGVYFEIGNALARAKYRGAAIELLGERSYRSADRRHPLPTSWVPCSPTGALN